MDILDTIAPKSDQQNYDDYIAGPRTVTVTGAKVVGGEQPVVLDLAEYPGRPYKPNKSMRRVLASIWGPAVAAYVGRSLVLVGNPDVKYGGKAVGGIEIAAMSHIDAPKSLPLTERRGQKKQFTVQPLKVAPAGPPRDWRAEADAQAGNESELRALWVEAQAAGADTETLTYIQGKAN